ncbi:hypothetical protein BSL78_29257 [Apostichopus japonicus]|uniref:Reverse transcriptase domain-containing protein n=1 Tax=Stichopus japonicus TaxID=307972 RepID=A0A2G8JDW7_STIJA|nr:hypothetical protein BSL78_29257 [Apostichopus japonicus]
MVAIGNSVSETYLMDCSVPQGSVAGPFMFTVYVSPLEDLIEARGVHTMMYTDDTQLYLVLNPAEARGDQLQRLEDCIRSVRAWTTANKLMLNDTKTQIGRIRKYIDRPTAERLVHAFVTSHLDANNSLLYGLPNSAIAKLQRVQNSAARVVLGVSGRDVNINALRKNELHWLPVKDRIVYKILLLTYKSLNGLSSYIRDLAAYTPGRSLRSASQALLVVPKSVSTKNYGDRAFSVAAPKLWNDLPHNIKTASSQYLRQF